MANRNVIVDQIIAERNRQAGLKFDGDTEKFDRGNTQNDWVGYITAYSGRAASKVERNKRENQHFRENMVKVGALALAAIEVYDNGYCMDI